MVLQNLLELLGVVERRGPCEPNCRNAGLRRLNFLHKPRRCRHIIGGTQRQHTQTYLFQGKPAKSSVRVLAERMFLDAATGVTRNLTKFADHAMGTGLVSNSYCISSSKRTRNTSWHAPATRPGRLQCFLEREPGQLDAWRAVDLSFTNLLVAGTPPSFQYNTRKPRFQVLLQPAATSRLTKHFEKSQQLNSSTSYA